MLKNKTIRLGLLNIDSSDWL